MLVYILTGAAACLSLKNYEDIKDNDLTKENKWLKIFYRNCAVFILTIVFGFRDYGVGTDTKNYLEIFNRIGSKFTNKTYVYEKGFCFVSILTNKIFGSFTVFLLVFGLILHWNLVMSFCKLSESPSISMLCYFGFCLFAQSCNILRQYVALSFCLIALCYLLKSNSIMKFISFVFIGFLFHKTALIFLVVIPLKYIKFSKLTALILICLFILVNPLLPYFVKVVDFIFSGVNYLKYLNISSNLFTFENILSLFVMLVVVLLLIIFKNRIEKQTENKEEYSYYSNIFLIFVGLFIMSMFTTELVNRIAIFFMPSVFFIIPIILKTFKPYTKKLMICFLMLTFIFLASYLLIIKGSYGVMPYIFI